MPATAGFLNQAEWGHLWSGQEMEFDAWQNTLYIPFLTATTSITVIFVQLILQFWLKTPSDASWTVAAKLDNEEEAPGFRTKLRCYIISAGGWKIVFYKVLRLVGCLFLFALSVVEVFESRSEDHAFDWRSPKVTLCATYWYTSFLSAASLTGGSWTKLLTRHNISVLLTTLGVFIYRNVWPLATYDKGPMDASEGQLMWFKLGALTISALIVPLFIPRQYVPVDPKNPMEVLNSEQTASLFSLMVYTFLDSIIFEAYRVSHLSHTRLPVLADYDRSKYLTEKAFPHLDPFQGAGSSHLFFRLLRVFFWEYLAMSIALTGQTIFRFASPLAVNRILASLETDGQEDTIHPWFWVACLFFGPLLVSISFQGYIYFGTMVLARIQAILTELVFEHSLRVRFKAEAEGGGTKTPLPSATPAATPDTQSVAGSSSDNEENETTSVRTESSTSKGKGKATPTSSQGPAAAAPSEKKNNIVGKINTLITVDIDNILNAKDFLMMVLQVPLELLMALLFLYKILGWSALVGFLSIVVLLPVPGYVASRIQSINRKKMDKTDSRVQSVSETIGVIRMIKLFGWERKMANLIGEKREEELSWIWKDKVINLSNDIVNFLIPTITMIVTYTTYTLFMGKSLNSSVVFSSMAVFDIIRSLLHRISWIFSESIKGKVSLERVAKFLEETELLDRFTEALESSDVHAVVSEDTDNHGSVIGFNNASFTWANDAEDGSQTPSSRIFRLRIDGSLTFKKGCINLIVGPTGCGKTSILMALLGEMHFTPPNVDSWYNLPRGGGVAYAAQESWVQNETIKENILFGSPYDEERYRKVIRQCALERDLQLFEAGDETEVGEKGLTLSGGQKARVTLARAIYSSAEIILLDDVLAALDVHTSRAIVENCFKGDLIRGRTVLLVTHNVALTSPIADFIVSVGSDGVAHEMGTDISFALASDPALAEEMGNEAEVTEIEEQVIDTPEKEKERKDGKLILAEEIAEGHVSWTSLKLFFKALGGTRPLVFFSVWTLGIALMHAGNMFSVWFLGYWGTQYEIRAPEDIEVPYYLSVYSFILLASLACYLAAQILYIFAGIRGSRSINSQLVESILGSTLRWLDETPASRIIARCTGDIAALDGEIMMLFAATVEIAICMLVKLSGPVIMTPVFLLPGIVVTLVGVYIGNIYLKAQMSVKREMSNARSPVLAHFGAAIAGLTSIRAYGAQQFFRTEALKRIDHYTKIARTSYNLNRWIAIRIDLLGTIFTTTLAAYLLVNKSLSAANTGFSLTMSLEFCALILWLVRLYNDFEVQANSLERIQGYLNIEHEPKPTDTGKPPAAWPTSGDLRVENLSSRYSQNGPKVLHELSFHVKAGERIGIVGRTGSGKSSLTLSLLRCILTEGVVYYDGVPTNTLNLDELRSKITIIPQMPELLSGTLRRNLDPFDQHDDSTLNDALRASGLFSLQTEDDEARLTLDSPIASGGNNLSVGQRQIIALARAIVRNSKLLILDEATSAIDHKTDSIIQSSLRNELGPDVTILTIAHRLQTIMDADQIMVLDEGRIVEYDSPQALLGKRDGYFKSLVDGSGDKSNLYDMVAQKTKNSFE